MHRSYANTDWCNQSWKALVPVVTDIEEDWTAVFKPCPKVTKVSSNAIELKSSRGTYSSIAIELKVDGQRALILSEAFWWKSDIIHSA